MKESTIHSYYTYRFSEDSPYTANSVRVIHPGGDYSSLSSVPLKKKSYANHTMLHHTMYIPIGKLMTVFEPVQEIYIATYRTTLLSIFISPIHDIILQCTCTKPCFLCGNLRIIAHRTLCWSCEPSH